MRRYLLSFLSHRENTGWGVIFPPPSAAWVKTKMQLCHVNWPDCQDPDMISMTGGEIVAVPKQSTTNHGLGAKHAFGNDVTTPRPDLI